MKIVIRVVNEGETFFCRMHPNDMESLEIVDGDYVLLRGKKRSETVLKATEDEAVSPGELWANDVVRINTFTTSGDEVGIESCHDIKFGKAVGFQLFQSPASPSPDFGTDSFPEIPVSDMKRILKEFFQRRRGYPLCKLNYVILPGGISAKILDTDPVSYCLVTETTNLIVKEGKFDMKTDLERSNFVGYDNIGGCSRQLEQIKEAIDLPLRHPELFKSVGISQPRGILMYGPPGTGKTLIARAVANETGAFFFTINGPEVMSKLAGESEANLRKIFKESEEKSPSVIFIDEIDSMAPKRDKTQGEVDKRIVSQLLTLMDGLKEKSNVIIIGATNRPNSIDPALRRYGRFEREINIGVPDMEGRVEILKIHTRKLRVSKEVNLREIASKTHGYVGADLAQVCTEAAMICIRENARRLDTDTDTPLDERILMHLVVKPEHFERALRNSKPANLREAMVEIPNVKWTDIGGLEEVKSKMMEMIKLPIESPELYSEFGLTIPKGVLLYGPPGCGKTMMAKAIASECGANFLSVKGPELLSMWLGEAESNVRELFEKARQASPCIIFFDEIDALAKSRGMSMGSDPGSNAVERVLTQILTEMDGISSSKQVFVVGATNRPEVIDSAILRPGRLDQLIYIPLPDRPSRETILRNSLARAPLSREVLQSEFMDFLVNITDDCSGADIVEFCQRTIRYALRETLRGSNPEKRVERAHFERISGEVRKSVNEFELQKFRRFEESQRG